jgi:hypothetical protein
MCRYDPLALHEAEPAVDEKWVAQLWVRPPTSLPAPLPPCLPSLALSSDHQQQNHTGSVMAVGSCAWGQVRQGAPGGMRTREGRAAVAAAAAAEQAATMVSNG